MLPDCLTTLYSYPLSTGLLSTVSPFLNHHWTLPNHNKTCGLVSETADLIMSHRSGICTTLSRVCQVSELGGIVLILFKQKGKKRKSWQRQERRATWPSSLGCPPPCLWPTALFCSCTHHQGQKPYCSYLILTILWSKHSTAHLPSTCLRHSIFLECYHLQVSSSWEVVFKGPKVEFTTPSLIIN